jgi:hypothetical protein
VLLLLLLLLSLRPPVRKQVLLLLSCKHGVEACAIWLLLWGPKLLQQPPLLVTGTGETTAGWINL